jgi:hypothetical protein
MLLRLVQQSTRKKKKKRRDDEMQMYVARAVSTYVHRKQRAMDRTKVHHAVHQSEAGRTLFPLLLLQVRRAGSARARRARQLFGDGSNGVVHAS